MPQLEEATATWLDACPLCDGAISELEGYAEAHLSRCEACGFVFARRSPGDGELAEYYSRYGSGWHDSEVTRARYRELLAGMQRFRAKNRILDVGCGAGFFLEEARDAGWEVHGSEFGAKALAINRSKGIDIVEAPLRYDSFEPGSFDVITAFEVFEHLRDPRGEAAVIAHLLRPGGLLYCTTPNFNAVTRRILGSDWRVITYPEHLCYFTASTLVSWLRPFGFRPVAIATTGFTAGALRRRFARSSDDTSAATASENEQIRQTIEGSRTLTLAKAVANRALSTVRAGDTLKGWFELQPEG